MKILVPVKRVPDYEAKVKIAPDNASIIEEGIKWIVNPFDAIAVEEAIRLKEAGHAESVVVTSMGPAEGTSQQLRQALAMGADSAIHGILDSYIDSDVVSRFLEFLVKRDNFNLVLMGKQAIDSDRNQTAQLLAARLNVPQACFASSVRVIEEGKLEVVREVDGGLETVEATLPCVISADLRLNEPRYASLPNIMKAKKKPLEEIAVSECVDDVSPKIRIKSLRYPPTRKAGRTVGSVEELVDALKNEAKVL